MMIDPFIWYAERELNFVPHHFVKCPTPINKDSKEWIINKISGRYAFADVIPKDRTITNLQNVFFENEKDATLYELFWASSSQ